MSEMALPVSRRARNYRFASTAVLPAYFLVAGAALANGAPADSPQILFAAVVAVVMQGAGLVRSDEVLGRLITPLLTGAAISVAVIMTVFEDDRALLAAPVIGLLAIGVPFMAERRTEIAVSVASAASVSVGLALAGMSWPTIAIYVLMFLALWSTVTTMSRQQRLVLADEDAARQEARQLADLLVSASTLSETEPADVVRRLAGAGRTLGFDAVGVLRPVGDDLEGMVGDVPPRLLLAAISRYDEDPVGGDAVARYELEGGRHAVVGRLGARGRLFGTVVAVASKAATVTPARVRTFGTLLQLAAQALEGAYRYTDQRRTVRRLLDLESAKMDFISNVSHELRTPLTVIKGLGQTLTGGRVPLHSPPGVQLVGRLAANAERLGRMVASLLDTSRLYQEGVRVDLQPVILAEVVKAVVDRLETLSLHHHLECRLEDQAMVLADPALLEHVLENLLSNAVKHTPPGTTVVVVVQRRDDRAVVRVSDDGPGIPAAELPRLTERFFRGGNPMTRETSGLGLGLALVADILLAHGSRLHVESGEGQGAEFAFSLEILDEA